MNEDIVDEETVWITEDDVFDLIFLLCDMLYDEGFVRSSYRVEQLVDEFLGETGRATSMDAKRSGAYAEETFEKLLKAKDTSSRAAALMLRADNRSKFVTSRTDALTRRAV